MYAAFEYLKWYRIYAEIDIEYAVAFARCPGEQSPRIPAIAAHAADRLPPDHPHIGLPQRLEKAYGFKGDSCLRSEHGHHPDASWCENLFASLRFQIKDTDRPLLMNQGQAQLGYVSRWRLHGINERGVFRGSIPYDGLSTIKDPFGEIRRQPDLASRRMRGEELGSFARKARVDLGQ